MKTQKVINGISFSAETNDKVIEVITRVMSNRTRIRVYYGDIVTGRSWLEEHDITGYIGRSTGTNPIPLLVFNKRSYGGGGLLDSAIIKITESAGGRVLYAHPTFHTPDFKIMDNGFNNGSYSLLANGEVHATGTRNQMINLCKKLS